MQQFLFDTNLISELRKGRRCDPALLWWFKTISEDSCFLSVVTIGEIRFGIEHLRKRDARNSLNIELWLEETSGAYGERILPISAAIAEKWGKLRILCDGPVADGLIAATASHHNLTVATRNEKDFENFGIKVFNPFSI